LSAERRSRAAPHRAAPEPDRAALHLLLDKALDRSPELEDGLQRLLRSAVDRGNDPGVQRAVRVLIAVKQLGEAMGARSSPAAGFGASGRDG
jgi:hypothetical protein